VIRANFSFQNTLHEWENQVGDFLLNYEWFSDNEEEEDNEPSQSHNTPEPDTYQGEYEYQGEDDYEDGDYYEEYYEEDKKERSEQAEISRMERAASKRDRY
jgi:hypothetical protein